MGHIRIPRPLPPLYIHPRPRGHRTSQAVMAFHRRTLRRCRAPPSDHSRRIHPPRPRGTPHPPLGPDREPILAQNNLGIVKITLRNNMIILIAIGEKTLTPAPDSTLPAVLSRAMRTLAAARSLRACLRAHCALSRPADVCHTGEAREAVCQSGWRRTSFDLSRSE